MPSLQPSWDSPFWNSPPLRQRGPCRDRQGIATLWVLAFGAIVILLFVFLTDTARMYLARLELQNALDAAALSAAKTRCQNGVTTAVDMRARTDAREAFRGNFTSITAPSAVAIRVNGGGADANGNSQLPPLTNCPDGLVLLGSIHVPSGAAPSTLEFDANQAPDKAVLTVRAGPSSDGFLDPNFFTLSFQGGASATIQAVTLNLAPPGAVFQPGLGVDDATGYGPFPVASATPIASYSLTPGDAANSTLTIVFDGSFTTGQTVRFGMDTDRVGLASSVLNASAIAGATVTASLSNGAILAGTLTNVSGGQVEAELFVGVNECAAQVHACVEVQSIAPSILGEVFGPYTVRGRSTAWFRCNETEPSLVRVK